ncbi:MAG: 50S ribosomal protein L22 [Rickettsiales bacterium]|nr:50S ribosomal protein L22 [Rickettsiales bacterium]
MKQAKNNRRVQESEARCFVKSIRISPQKLGLVADLIRGLKASEALIQLQFSQKRVAKIVKDALNSVIANAENNHDLDIDNLIVHRVNVGKSIVMKRFRARARGRGARILKPFSNLEIIVKEIN